MNLKKSYSSSILEYLLLFNSLKNDIGKRKNYNKNKNWSKVVCSFNNVRIS